MYDTDQEQIEAMKKWWVQYGNWVIGGFIIFIAAYIGVYMYKSSAQNHRLEASAAYEQLIVVMTKTPVDAETKNELITTLKSDFNDLGYGSMAALLEAKANVDDGDFAAALADLTWALDNSDDQLKVVINFRIAQVQYALGLYDEALTSIASIEGQGHKAVSYELKGDILLAQGKKDEARAAYEVASTSSTNEGIQNPYLKIKLDDLAVAN